ncbi:AI-2E family transporter [Streptomyces sp. NPDC005244]|uniref:AI-2E family transporter n=1 Tax=Streptomyces sp. NPDC005244 TaxID=3364708 RepID=UPI0036C3C865
MPRVCRVPSDRQVRPVRFRKRPENPDAGQERAGNQPSAPPPAPSSPPVGVPSASGRPEPVSVVPWGIRVGAEVGWRLLVLAAILWVLIRVISVVHLIVLSFAAALLITALLQPTVTRLQRHRVPKGLATAATALCGFVLLGLVGWFVVWQVMDSLDDLTDQLQNGVDDLKRWLLKSPFHITEARLNHLSDKLGDSIGSSSDQLTAAGLHGVTVLAELLTGVLLTVFSTLFLLYDGPRIWKWTLKFAPAPARSAIDGAGPLAWRTLTSYVHGTVIVAFIDAVCIGLGIYILDVPLALPLAVVIFAAAFVPLVGAVASGALAVIVAFVTQGVFTALLVLLIVLGVQQLEGHVLQPFILGRAVRVHPLGVILSVAAGGLIAGIGGAVVAVPLVAVANTVAGHLLNRDTESPQEAPE